MKSPHNVQRAEWLGLLARAPEPLLEKLADPVLAAHQFETIRSPEIGLVMANARIDGSGNRFNIAEIPVTRCTLRRTQGYAGVGYRLGRCPEMARRIAKLDALLQDPDYESRVRCEVLEPISHELACTARKRAEATQTSRVSFDTLIPENL